MVGDAEVVFGSRENVKKNSGEKNDLSLCVIYTVERGYEKVRADAINYLFI